jgi:isoprenylcysteine carboxyl methyltransferase (ICMT) family protein YpbQ
MSAERRTATAAPPPRSATSFFANLLALAAGLAVIWALARAPAATAAGPHPWQLLSYQPLLPCLAVFSVLVAAEWVWRARRAQRLPEFAPAPVRALSLTRVALRLYGLAATLALVALAYWLFPEYHGDFYLPYWQLLRLLAPCLVLVPPYLVWADRRTREEHDELLEFGLLLSGRQRNLDGALLRRHALGWTVKAFFLPLMAVYLSQEINFLYGIVRTLNLYAFTRYDAWYHLCFAIDLLFCVVGYIATLRLFDSQIRSVEPTLLGWLVALVCYQPFYSVLGSAYLQYEGAVNFSGWLAGSPLLRDALGVVIICLSLLYALATVAFGLRFSNLTHRGIITNGPYRYSKHPAYLTKNLSWWLISVPFALDGGWVAALRHCLLLLLLNGIYYLRARTEERHLSRDPVYVAYAEWMNEHGVLAPLGRALPWLRYRAPANARYW